MAPAPVPETKNLPKLREAAKDCKACDLWKTGTQTVFGEGSKSAEILFVGEQPGDKEDLAGKPFVGPAGRVFDEGLAAAGIDRRLAYVTNAVKHFKWEARGKRRIHQKPNAAELAACRPWLDAELEAVRPNVLVPMGATAAQALLGRQFRVSKDRGRPVESAPTHRRGAHGRDGRLRRGSESGGQAPGQGLSARFSTGLSAAAAIHVFAAIRRFSHRRRVSLTPSNEGKETG